VCVCVCVCVNSYVVKFEVESAGVADRVTVTVTPPQRRRRRQTVSTLQASSTSAHLRTTTRSQFTELNTRLTSIQYDMKIQFIYLNISDKGHAPLTILSFFVGDLA